MQLSDEAKKRILKNQEQNYGALVVQLDNMRNRIVQTINIIEQNDFYETDVTAENKLAYATFKAKMQAL